MIFEMHSGSPGFDHGLHEFKSVQAAAESCFGAKDWPADVERPQAWLEFDVEDVAEATREMESRGYRLLVANRTEPWGQVVSRLLSPEGLLVGLTMTPWMRAEGPA